MSLFDVSYQGSLSDKVHHNLFEGGIREPLFRDFSEAEHRYLERRHWEITNKLQSEANEKLGRINTQLDQLNAQANEAIELGRGPSTRKRAATSERWLPGSGMLLRW